MPKSVKKKLTSSVRDKTQKRTRSLKSKIGIVSIHKVLVIKAAKVYKRNKKYIKFLFILQFTLRKEPKKFFLVMFLKSS